METTKLSTKGQIVIPREARKGIDVGTLFVVIRRNDLLILKKAKGLTKQEMEEMKELDKIWKEIDSGKCKSYSEKEFFEKLKGW